MDGRYTLEGNIHGHHVYKSAWTPVIGEILDVQLKTSRVTASPRRHSTHLSLLHCHTLHVGTRMCEIDGNAPFFSHPQYKLHVGNFKRIYIWIKSVTYTPKNMVCSHIHSQN